MRTGGKSKTGEQKSEIMVQKRKNNPQQGKNNWGFTLVEIVVTISILGILIGLVTVSTNVIPRSRVARAAKSIGAALERTKTEASNRLVAEMKLEYRAGKGYYITYYLDRGKVGSQISASSADTEKIAPANLTIRYTTDSGSTESLQESDGNSLILTFDRATGAFRPVQKDVITQQNIQDTLEQGKDIEWNDDGSTYCTSIIIQSGSKTTTLTLNQNTGTYTLG